MLQHFFCSQCRAVVPPPGLHQRCPDCGGVLVAGYDYPAIRGKLRPDDLQSRTSSIWRYRELLPVADEASIVSLGEGRSPVVALWQAGKGMQTAQMFIKDDSVMPLGSFYSRLASVTVSKAREEKAEVIVARAGQLEACALAAYAARAGIATVLAVRREALQEIFEQNILSAGASLFTYEGSDSDADVLVDESALARGWFNASAFHHPYRLDGAKSIGLEMAEVFEWHLPEVIIVPAGGGTVLAGIYRAIRDLIALGWVENKLPRLVAVQFGGRHLLVEAWQAKKLGAPLSEEDGKTGFGEDVEFMHQSKYLALDAVYKSMGMAVSVSADEADEAGRLLALNGGVLISAAGAATLAAALKLDAEGWIKHSERVLLYNPGGSLVAAGPPISGRGAAVPMGDGLLYR